MDDHEETKGKKEKEEKKQEEEKGGEQKQEEAEKINKEKIKRTLKQGLHSGIQLKDDESDDLVDLVFESSNESYLYKSYTDAKKQKMRKIAILLKLLAEQFNYNAETDAKR